jgi:CelD/BcsL family acetyltransferase involved in cellulose biosynthesis
MTAPRIIRIESSAALRDRAAAWDDLWQRTGQVLPCGRAELIASWLDQLAPESKFTALAIEADGQLVAAIPLVQRRIAKLIPVVALPQNDWSWAGDLLLDPLADNSSALATLLAEIRRLGEPVLWFNAVPIQSLRWQAMLRTIADAGLHYVERPRFEIGTVEIEHQLVHDWSKYESAWSGNHRRHMRKALRRAEEDGGVELDVCRPSAPDEIEQLLREGFEVEHRSWKGQGGSSVLASPEKWGFFLREAQQLARHNHLMFVFLRHQGQAIAFEYGWWSQGIYYTPKVGYDSAYSQLSPGQLLRYLLFQRLFESNDCVAVDFLGPLADATAKWSTGTYPISKLVVETGNLRARVFLSLYHRAANIKRKFRPNYQQAHPLKIIDVERLSPDALPPPLVEA